MNATYQSRFTGYLRSMKEYGQVVMKLDLNLENNLNNSWNQEITIHKNVKEENELLRYLFSVLAFFPAF
jgi:hypothetical protein